MFPKSKAHVPPWPGLCLGAAGRQEGEEGEARSCLCTLLVPGALDCDPKGHLVNQLIPTAASVKLSHGIEQRGRVFTHARVVGDGSSMSELAETKMNPRVQRTCCASGQQPDLQLPRGGKEKGLNS